MPAAQLLHLLQRPIFLPAIELIVGGVLGPFASTILALNNATQALFRGKNILVDELHPYKSLLGPGRQTSRIENGRLIKKFISVPYILRSR